MTEPEDIEGVHDAHKFLGVGMQASATDTKEAFQNFAEGATDEEFWTAFKAREVALLGSIGNGKAVYNVLRRNIQPDDISSVACAQTLFDAAPPPQDSYTRNQYNSSIARSADTIEQRLRKLSKNTECEISEANIEAVRVAHYVLHYQDVEQGKRHVLGPDRSSSPSSSGNDKNSDGWSYSIGSRGEYEYYAKNDLLIQVYQNRGFENSQQKTVARVSENIDNYIEKEFNRYGDAKRQVKQWVLNPPDL